MDVRTGAYTSKHAAYFENTRPEVRRQITGRGLRVIDVGCGTGALLAALRDEGKLAEGVGIEVDPRAAALAAARLDRVLEIDIESSALPDDIGLFDYIICADVLEHLVDPWSALAKLRQLLAPDGRFVISIPNVRHLTVLLALALRGRWDYVPEGILDATHLRFFTRATALEMVDRAGLTTHEVVPVIRGRKARLLQALSGGLLRDLVAFQYLIVAG